MALKDLNEELRKLNEGIENDEDWNAYTEKVNAVWDNIKELMQFMEEKQFINNPEYAKIDEFYDELSNLNQFLSNQFPDSVK